MNIKLLYKDGDVLRVEHCQDLLVAAVLDSQLKGDINVNTTVDDTEMLLHIMDAIAIKRAGDENLVVWEPSYEYH